MIFPSMLRLKSINQKWASTSPVQISGKEKDLISGLISYRNVKNDDELIKSSERHFKTFFFEI